MAKDSLKVLKSAFHRWRQTKSYRGQAIPLALFERVQRAVAIHGMRNVVKATGFTQRQIERECRSRKKISYKGSGKPRTPSFSRIEITTPAIASQAGLLAEAETPGGVKLRIFCLTPETTALMSSICRLSGDA